MIARILTALALALMLALPIGGNPALAQEATPATESPVADAITSPALSAPTRPEVPTPQAVHQRALRWAGGLAIIGVPAILALFFLARGRIRVEGGLSGRTIPRFNGFERLVHWMTASSFIMLALSGLTLSFGHRLLRPLMGPEAFAMLASLGQQAHIHLGFPFALGVVLMLLLWAKDSIPNGRDAAWLAAGGGLIGSRRPEAGRFNAGQKAIVWITVLGGAVAAGSGFLLVFPMLAYAAPMAWLLTAHAVVGLAMTGAIIAHAWLRGVAMEGAFDAMGSGRVDLNWAKQHHGAWVEEELRKARATVAGRPVPKVAGAD